VAQAGLRFASTMTIVRTSYRYKRPPRKQKAVALDVPAIVKPTPMKKQQRGPVIRLGAKGAEAVNDNGNQPRPAAIVTAKNPRRGRFGDVPDMTPEEHKRRGDAADALFREMKRQIAVKLREGE
jgi:hypothetical protein